MEQVRLNLTLRESNALKGIALMMLLIHHLFYIDNGMWDDMTIGHYKLAHCLGVACKACVALFVFLSGYALGTTTAGKPVNVNKFYLRRFSKLYFNLWIIALFFVPLGVFIFDRNFQEVYADPIWMNAILDFLGLINITGQFGYNPTWWFYSCILLLYLIFPLVATCIYKWPKSRWIFLLCSILLVMVPWVWVQPIRWYAFPFILGIVSSKSLITNILPPPRKNSRLWKYVEVNGIGIIGIIALCILVAMALVARFVVPYALLWDSVIAVLIVWLYKCVKWNDRLHCGMEFIGKHSFNIFLFHTFIYYLFFPAAIYWSRQPMIIFLSLLLSCIGISIGLEKLKGFIGLNRLQDKIIRR